MNTCKDLANPLLIGHILFNFWRTNAGKYGSKQENIPRISAVIAINIGDTTGDNWTETPVTDDISSAGTPISLSRIEFKLFFLAKFLRKIKLQKCE